MSWIGNQLRMAGVFVEDSQARLLAAVRNGNMVRPSPLQGPWKGCPGPYADPAAYFEVFDDFVGLAIDDSTGNPTDWVFTGDVAAMVVLQSSQLGGVVRITADDAATNNGTTISKTGEPFAIVQNSGKKLWYGARVKSTVGTEDKQLLAFGLAGAGLDQDVMTDTTGALADSKDFVGFNILATASELIACSYKTASIAVVSQTAITDHLDAWHVFNLVFDGVISVQPWVDGVKLGTVIDVSATAFPEVGLTPYFGIKVVGTAADEIVDVDWVRCVQLR